LLLQTKEMNLYFYILTCLLVDDKNYSLSLQDMFNVQIIATMSVFGTSLQDMFNLQ